MENKMSEKEKYILRTAGTVRPPSKPVQLTAGTVKAEFVDGYLRYISYGSVEVVRQIYAAIRNSNWETVPGTISNLQIDQRSDSFLITYQTLHKKDDIHFVWNALISGGIGGDVTFRFEGEALSTFRRNRIGFCILHPMDAAGKPCRVVHTDGSAETGEFPELISPHQPFFNIQSMSWQATEGVTGRIRFSGDVFEMEDQRNWTDASFKTYCTPLSLPFPVVVEKGTKIFQEVVFSVHTDEKFSLAYQGKDEKGAMINIDEGSEGILPEIGLSLGDKQDAFSRKQLRLLSQLKCAHLRYDLYTAELLAGGDGARDIQNAFEAADVLGVPLEFAVHLGPSPEKELDRVLEVMSECNQADERPAVRRWIVFKDGEKTTDGNWISLASGKIKQHYPEADIISGTDAFFTELNRNRPDTGLADGLVYSLNPQVHAFDNNSLVETLAAQEVTVETAKSFSNGLPIHVGPVTFKMRWNPNATSQEPPVPLEELPRQVDARQMSLFGAGWTASSIRYLAKGGAASVTYYETVGWKGVMEEESGAPLPEKFPSIPGGVFPLYHVFRWLVEFQGGNIIPLYSSNPLSVDGIAVQNSSSKMILFANFTAERIVCTLLGTGEQEIFRTDLNEHNYEQASLYPEILHESEGTRVDTSGDGKVQIDILPYGVSRLMIKT